MHCMPSTAGTVATLWLGIVYIQWLQWVKRVFTARTVGTLYCLTVGLQCALHTTVRQMHFELGIHTLPTWLRRCGINKHDKIQTLVWFLSINPPHWQWPAPWAAGEDHISAVLWSQASFIARILIENNCPCFLHHKKRLVHYLVMNTTRGN